MRHFLSALLVVGLMSPASLSAQQDETLADIRQELSVLYVEMQRLKNEMNTTGASTGLATSGSILDRVNAIEAEMARLTSEIEQLEFRIDKVVADGTNRIGDLEFRLCELETSCDISTLEPGSTLGGEIAGGQTTEPEVVDPLESGPELAVSEEADFASAQAALDAGLYDDAAQKLGKFREDYPGGPLSHTAGLLQGDAYEKAGDLTQAARTYLDLFSEDQSGPVAPDALFRLGRSLGRLGKAEEACLTLAEVEVRYPEAGAALEARSAMQNIGCQ